VVFDPREIAKAAFRGEDTGVMVIWRMDEVFAGRVKFETQSGGGLKRLGLR
jgi:hypothetical protein